MSCGLMRSSQSRSSKPSVASQGSKVSQRSAVRDGFAAVFEFETTFSSRDGVAALRAATPRSLPDGVELAIDPVDATKFLENYDLIVTVIGPNDATPEELEAQAEITAEALRPLPTVTDAEALDLLTESFDPSTGEIEIRRTDFTRYAEQGDTAGTESVLIGITPETSGADADVLDSDEIQARLDQGIDSLDPAYRAGDRCRLRKRCSSPALQPHQQLAIGLAIRGRRLSPHRLADCSR